MLISNYNKQGNGIMNVLMQDPEVKALLVKKVFAMGLDKELLEE